MKQIREVLSWVDTVLQSSESWRKQFVRSILNGLRLYGSKNGEETKLGIEIEKSLKDTSLYELIGFSPNIMYIKANGEDEDQLKSIWVHPWGTPKLLYKHKKLPILIIAGPAIKLNDSIIKEVSINKYREAILGVTG